MILERLSMSRGYYYGEDAPPLTGEIQFKGKTGTVQIQLNEATSFKILSVVADQLVESSKELAMDLTKEVLEAANPLIAIEGTQDEERT